MGYLIGKGFHSMDKVKWNKKKLKRPPGPSVTSYEKRVFRMKKMAMKEVVNK